MHFAAAGVKGERAVEPLATRLGQSSDTGDVREGEDPPGVLEILNGKAAVGQEDVLVWRGEQRMVYWRKAWRKTPGRRRSARQVVRVA